MELEDREGQGKELQGEGLPWSKGAEVMAEAQSWLCLGGWN